jgi:hypothetical protein
MDNRQRLALPGQSSPREQLRGEAGGARQQQLALCGRGLTEDRLEQLEHSAESERALVLPAVGSQRQHPKAGRACGGGTEQAGLPQSGARFDNQRPAAAVTGCLQRIADGLKLAFSLNQPLGPHSHHGRKSLGGFPSALGPGSSDTRRMQSVRVIVELERDNQRLCGWLTDPDGQRRRFDGWLELASKFAELQGSGTGSAAREARPA